MSEQREKNNNRKGGKLAFTVCIVVIVILLGMVVYLLAVRPVPQEEETVRRNVVVNEENVEEVLATLGEQRTPPGSYEVTMNSTWNFANGDAASGNAYVKNAETNTNAVYFDITLADTGEILYESPILPIGSYLEEITLDSTLSAGTYDCLITYHLLDENDKSISTVKLTLTIIIAH